MAPRPRVETYLLRRSSAEDFTFDDLVRGLQRAGVPVREVADWLDGARRAGTVTDTGRRRHGRGALNGARLYRLREERVC